MAQRRRAENELRFRDANESLLPHARAASGGDDSVLLPFLCECPNPRCTAVLRLTLEEYEAVRSVPTDGFCLPGHEDPLIERVLEEHERFTRIRKIDGPAKLSEETDLRA